MLRREFIQNLALSAASCAAGGVGFAAANAARAAPAGGNSSAPAGAPAGAASGAGARAPSRFAETPYRFSRVAPGIDVLAAGGFAQLRGQRVALLTHPAGVNRRGQKSIDVLRHARGVNLVKLFGPEHGIYGDVKAAVAVQNNTDPRTGLPVFSLYGKHRKPTPEMLDGVDTLVVDLQDVGARTYTYVSCMKLVLEACFEAGVKVLVLDRPNPLGGLKVDGPGMDKKWMSYVGSFQVPYVHGLTIGELALAATRTAGWLELSPAARRAGRLEVVKMSGWRRWMRWRDTGLRWLATSPRIPSVEAAEGYPMTGLGCETDDFAHGVKTIGGAESLHPFRLLQYKGRRASDLERVLRARNIAGLGFSPMRLKSGENGVYVSILDWARWRPTELNFHMMQLACLWEPRRTNPFLTFVGNKKSLFLKHLGCEAFFDDLCKRGAEINIEQWLQAWQRDALAFQQWSKNYWLYKS
ncbi:MAG: DUF1343 domain-containing protein [Puniceicoccales bacterium]|jgi:uncharacterized protein YbbC (DUF1343 family)|nr:DUF1343 domain-containing protein [Puniceicoccales bacterium]